MPDSSKMPTSAPLVCVGSWAKNNIAPDDTLVRRRHALIANYPNGVGLYDLDSTRASRLVGDTVYGRAFRDGVYRVMVEAAQSAIDFMAGYGGSAALTQAAHRGLENRRVKRGCVMPGESPAVNAGAAPQRCRWQATQRPSPEAWPTGTCSRQTAIACGQRGWKGQPGGGFSRLGISPSTICGARCCS